MKVIFMGTPDFAVGTLKALHEAGHEITLVVSQPDKPKGRGHALQPTPVKAAAEHLGLPVFQPAKVREAADMLEQTPADVIVVAAFGQLIPSRILHMKKFGCVNVHASLLPKYRVVFQYDDTTVTVYLGCHSIDDTTGESPVFRTFGNGYFLDRKSVV